MLLPFEYKCRFHKGKDPHTREQQKKEKKKTLMSNMSHALIPEATETPLLSSITMAAVTPKTPHADLHTVVKVTI